MTTVVSVADLHKSYGKFKAINGVDFEVKKGEIFGLLGPNGSGKSTTINCMLSLLEFDSGTIKLFGKEMSPDATDLKSKIGVVFQEVAVFDELTVYDNIDYFCGLYIRDKAKRAKYIEDAIELVGLGDFKKFRPKQLSGGLKRRLNIACGIAHKPELIFLDEPTVAVDPQSRNNILEGIKKLRDNGATVIYTSHYMEEVEELCDTISIIDKGKEIAEGTANQLKSLIDVDEKVTIDVEKLTTKNMEHIRDLAGVDQAFYNGKTLEIHYSRQKHDLGDLLDYLKAEKKNYARIVSEQPSLNDVFLALTGKELRDN